MNDYYNLKVFPPIKSNQLIVEFKMNNLIKNGALSIWGDSIGKPGDIVYEINNIEVDGNAIVFLFGRLRIVVYEPQNIVINEKVIGIDKAKRVNWFEDNFELDYEFINSNLSTITKKGLHDFRSDINEPAFLYYTW